jgi:acyl carrier protein
MQVDEEIAAADISAVYPRVAQIIADALGCDTEQVQPKASLIADLGAESIDFLDIVFRLERAFQVKIPRGQIVEDARGALTEEEFAHRGLVSEAGLERLRAYLSEVPAERFPRRLKLADVPVLFTPETFCKLVLRARTGGAG